MTTPIEDLHVMFAENNCLFLVPLYAMVLVTLQQNVLIMEATLMETVLRGMNPCCKLFIFHNHLLLFCSFGVCCLFVSSSTGDTISHNSTYIQNPNFPNAYGSTTAISWTVNKCSAGK